MSPAPPIDSSPAPPVSGGVLAEEFTPHPMEGLPDAVVLLGLERD